MQQEHSQLPNNKSQKINLSLDLRVVTAVLLVIILGMLLLWQPWSAAGANDRTITVTGSSAIKAEPDEFVFYPTYEFTSTDRQATLADASKKSDEITSGLKNIGLKDSQIKSSVNGGDKYRTFPAPAEDDSGETTYTLQMTVTTASRDIAQKVQDYIVTTSPSGAVTPQPNFSSKKRKEIESKARDEATKEARAKAEQSAKNLGFTVGKVKSVNDDNGFGIYPMYGRDSVEATDKPVSSLPIQPGENELNYSVTVTYYLK